MKTTDLKKFTDYRAFLVAHVQDCKLRKNDWTFGIFARQLGLKDPSSITKIIQGQREPGEAITGKLIRYFQFNTRDAQYFQDLIRLRKMKNDPRLTVMLLEKMGKDHPDASLKLLDDKAFQLISNWYCIAIREMVRLDAFVSDPAWISKTLQFKVTPTEAGKAIELLIQAGLLNRTDGKLSITQGRFQTSNDLSSEAIKRYHESMLDHAKEALRKFEPTEREFTASTVTMNSSRIGEAKELIREFKGRFAKLLEEDNGDVTTQIQIQFFPLTKFLAKKTSPNLNQEMKERSAL